MESLVQWYAENGSALWTTIISFMSVYGVALFSLVIGIIRTKLASIKAANEANERMAKIIADFEAKIDEMEKAVIEASNVNTEKRVKAMQDIVDSVTAANNALPEANTTSDTLADELANMQ